MYGLVRIAIALGISAAASFALANPSAKTAKEIMTKLNKGANAPLVSLKRDIQKDNPNWSEAQAQAKEYSSMAGELKDATPPKGDMASWSKLAKDYGEAAKSLNDAVQKKDKSAALTAYGKLTNACAACHKAHRD